MVIDLFFGFGFEDIIFLVIKQYKIVNIFILLKFEDVIVKSFWFFL